MTNKLFLIFTKLSFLSVAQKKPNVLLFADEESSPAKGEKRKRDPEDEDEDDDD